MPLHPQAEAICNLTNSTRVAIAPSEDERWQHSVYIDTVDGQRTIYFDDFTPISDTRTYLPPLAGVHSIVFAIDMTNAKPGTSGRLWIRNVALQK